jgi:hypothetical protein
VTPTKKILLAAAFVAAGYGVASLLGAPQLQIIRGPQPLADAAPAPDTSPEMRAALPNVLSETGARLVPDVQPPAASAAFDRNFEDVRAPFESRSQSEFELTSVSEPPIAGAAPTDLPIKKLFIPRATLRNEAPRALVIGPRDQVTVKDVPRSASFVANVAPEGIPSGEAAYRESGSVLQTHYSQNLAPADEAARAADIVAAGDVWNEFVAPMPPVNYEIDHQSRSHVVVDGDSLAKLAERYLDDPRRASEIYELNRNVLSHPDVLPIGTELTIPSRSASLHTNSESPQSLLPQGTAIHAASRGGLVPVRPVPPGGAVMPRAHLAQPRPVAGTFRRP